MKKVKFAKVLSTIMALVLCAVMLASCGGGETPAPPTAPPEPTAPVETEVPAAAEPDDTYTVTDMTGRVVTIAGTVTRVVALTASDCEILYAIGAGDTLVGRGEYCDYPEAVLSVPALQSGANTNIEEIIAMDPQVVILSTMAQSVEQIDQLEQAGIPVVVSNAADIAGTYDAITLIGAVMGREAEATAVIDGMKATFEAVSGLEGIDGKTIYFEVSELKYGLWTAGTGTFMDEIATMIGVTNCFGDVSDWSEVSEEQVLERNPDYIVTIVMYFGDGPTPLEELQSRDGWQNVTAIKNGALLYVQNNELARPGPRLADGARMLYDFLNETR
jgi:iron complex transport system substrate-binding protein